MRRTREGLGVGVSTAPIRAKPCTMTAERIFAALGLALVLFVIGALAWRDLGWRNRRRTQVEGEVARFAPSMNDGVEVFAPVIRFSADGAEHEVTDVVYSARPKRAVGDKIKLIYPSGRPDLARISRPAMWVMIYGVLVFMAAIMAALAAG